MGVSTTAKVVAAGAVAALSTVLINPTQVGATAMDSVSKGSVELIPRCVDAASGTAVWEAFNKNSNPVTVSWTNLDTTVSGSFVATAGSTELVTDYEAGVNNNTKLSYDTTDGTVKDEVERNANNGTACYPDMPADETEHEQDDQPVTPAHPATPQHEADDEDDRDHKPGKGHGHQDKWENKDRDHKGHGHGKNQHEDNDCEEAYVEEDEEAGRGEEEVTVEVTETETAEVETIEAVEAVETEETAAQQPVELANTGASTTLPAILAGLVALTALIVALPARLSRKA